MQCSPNISKSKHMGGGEVVGISNVLKSGFVKPREQFTEAYSPKIATNAAS